MTTTCTGIPPATFPSPCVTRSVHAAFFQSERDFAQAMYMGFHLSLPLPVPREVHGRSGGNQT